MVLKQHHIKRQLLDFQFKNKPSALAWQQKVPSSYQRDYVIAIEKVLNEFDDGRCQQIDRIIVDLGTVSEDKVADQLEKTLNSILKKTILKNVRHFEIANIDPKTKTTVNLQVNSSKEELFYIFRYFITQGSFPWSVTLHTISELQQRLQEQFTTDELVAQLLVKKTFQGALKRTRFFYQFDHRFVSEVLEKYFAKQFSGLKDIVEVCEKQFRKPFLSKHFKKTTNSIASQSILEWIAFIAPNDQGSWLTEFIPWFIEKQWDSKTPFTHISMWASSEMIVQKDSTRKVIHNHLKKVFRHLDLHLSAISKDNTFSKSKSAHINDGPNAPLITPPENEKVGAKKPEESLPNDEEVSSQEKNRKEATHSRNEVIGEPVENETSDISKQQPALPKELEQVDENMQKTPAKEFEKNPQKPINDSVPVNESDEVVEDLTSRLEKPLEVIDQSGEHVREDQQQERVENSLPNENKAILDDSELNPSTPQEDLIVSKEFYKEVQETIDTGVPHGKEFWDAIRETGNSTALEPYYIHDGGLVLIWPYLKRLFEKLNYVKNKEFESKEMQERAVTLLGYIATGNPICEEHQLVFAKFLCNWPFRMPIKKALELKKEELEEANSMLKGLISNWSVLKNTSVNGLRETFFYREGKLEAQEDDWKLTIEQKGTDILLDRLPYSISIIKLPWLKKLLRVDWA